MTTLTLDRSVRRHARQTRWLSNLAASVGFVALLMLYLPIVMLIALSFSSDPLSGRIGEFTTTWYRQLLQGGDFDVGQPLLLSLALAAVTAILCAGAALAVGRTLPKMKAQAPLVFMFLLPLLIPGVLLGAGVFTYYRVLVGVKMGLWSLCLAHFMWAFPFALLSMLIVAGRFDYKLLEAASDLGATRWQQFKDIELPLLSPGIYAGGFFSFLLSFNELSRSIFMRKGEMTLPIYLWAKTGGQQSTVPLIYAMSSLIAVVSMVLTYFAVRMMFRKEN